MPRPKYLKFGGELVTLTKYITLYFAMDDFAYLTAQWPEFKEHCLLAGVALEDIPNSKLFRFVKYKVNKQLDEGRRPDTVLKQGRPKGGSK